MGREAGEKGGQEMRRRYNKRSDPHSGQINFQYAVSCRYDTYRDCEVERCDGICRCTKIIDPYIAEVRSHSIIADLKSQLPKGDLRLKDEVFLYCLERFASRLRTEDFYINVVRGYYGEEIGGVYLSDETKAKHLLSLETSREQVEFILTLEYGYVLEQLLGKDWIAEEVPLDKIRVGNEYRKLDREQIDRCRENLSGGTKLSCLTTTDYKLIDGYHRHQASVEGKASTILTIHPEF